MMVTQRVPGSLSHSMPGRFSAILAELPANGTYHFKTIADLVRSTSLLPCRYPGDDLMDALAVSSTWILSSVIFMKSRFRPG